MDWKFVAVAAIAVAMGAAVYDRGQRAGREHCPAYAAAEAERWARQDEILRDALTSGEGDRRW